MDITPRPPNSKRCVATFRPSSPICLCDDLHGDFMTGDALAGWRATTVERSIASEAGANIPPSVASLIFTLNAWACEAVLSNSLSVQLAPLP